METPLPHLLTCPEPGCTFTYNPDRPGPYRNHKAGVHNATVKVTYSGPTEDALLVRIDQYFRCIRCSYQTSYPNVIQVRRSMDLKVFNILNHFFIRNTPGLVKLDRPHHQDRALPCLLSLCKLPFCRPPVLPKSSQPYR